MIKLKVFPQKEGDHLMEASVEVGKSQVKWAKLQIKEGIHYLYKKSASFYFFIGCGLIFWKGAN